MENEAQDASNGNTALINSVCEITSASKEEANFFLESHQWNLDAAVSTFLDDAINTTITAPYSRICPPTNSPRLLLPRCLDLLITHHCSRIRHLGLAPRPRLRLVVLTCSIQAVAERRRQQGRPVTGAVEVCACHGSGSDSDEPQQYYTGGEKSGMRVQDPTKGNDVDAISGQARQAGGVERPADHFQPSNAFIGTARKLSGETVSYVPQPPEAVNHVAIFWRNGFTIDDGPSWRLDG